MGCSKSNRILLCAHWDTRPWADRDANPENHTKPVIGASDGASGVAVLLEIARLISLYSPNYGVDIVFFDAEDFGNYGNNESWALGSKKFAQNLKRKYHPQFAILLDLIGDADQQIYIEHNSYQYAREIVDMVWNRAQNLGVVAALYKNTHSFFIFQPGLKVKGIDHETGYSPAQGVFIPFEFFYHALGVEEITQ